MANVDLRSHVEDIINILNDDAKNVTAEELQDELEKFMEYGVPIEQAKQTLIKKFGGGAKFNNFEQGSGERKLLSDLKGNQRNVKILAHVVAINPKEVNVKGDIKKIFYGILGDESGTIQFTSWKDDIDIEKGDVVEISNAYTKEWRGEPQLNFGDRVNIKKVEKSSLPDSAFKPHEYKVEELRAGLGKVEVTARIVDIEEREIEVDGTKKKVFSGIIADETGKAQFTSWHDYKLKEDDVLKISGGYVKTWRGIPQLTFDENAKVEKLDKKKISKKQIETKTLPLHRIVNKNGAIDVETQGTIIDIQPGSGLINRCPECNRTLRDGECNIHGTVDGIADLRVKMIVDDGTGAINAILNKKLTEEILGKSFEECKKMDNDELIDEINTTLFGKNIKLQGNAMSDNYGTKFIPNTAELYEIDIKDETDKLLEDLEDLL